MINTEYRERFPKSSKKPFLKGCFLSTLRHKYQKICLMKIKSATPPTKIAQARSRSSEVILACLVKSNSFILFVHNTN